MPARMSRRGAACAWGPLERGGPRRGGVKWGRVSEPAGLALEALQERECSCRGFSLVLPAYGVFVSTSIGDVC
jgi:hypothetical protein